MLQGSAHTGPALTPAEVLVAIHDIVPEKEGIALKKVCSCLMRNLVHACYVVLWSMDYESTTTIFSVFILILNSELF